jgi:hypothetical protein
LDWTLAIRRNRDQIRTIVLTLFTLARMRVGGSLFTLPRSTIAMIMLVLRPAESCVRRLIVIAAHGLKPSPSSISSKQPGGWPDLPPRGGPQAGETGGSPWQVGAADRGGRAGRKAFKLFDPLKHFDPEAIWDVQPVWESGYGLTANFTYHSENPAEPLNATHLGQRLNALMRALDTIPAQARRLIRWQAKRDAALKAYRPTRMSPMRPGLPPGWRERKLHAIDDVLRECHGLAHDRLNAPPNTS